MSEPINIKTVEGEDVFLVARPQSPSGETLTIVEISAATISVYERDSGTTTPAFATMPLALSVLADPPGTGGFLDKECMFATLQDDGWWTISGGYTFWTVLRYASFPLKGGKAYTIEVKLTAGHTATAWPNLDNYGNIVLTWTTTPRASVG